MGDRGWRRVVLRATIEYEAEVWADMAPDEINFHRNESSWCAGNIVGELAHYAALRDGCLCDCVKIEYVKEADRG